MATLYNIITFGLLVTNCVFVHPNPSASRHYEGDECTYSSNGLAGLCKRLRSCDFAMNNLKQGERPQHCSFLGSEEVVCCPVTRQGSRINSDDSENEIENDKNIVRSAKEKSKSMCERYGNVLSSTTPLPEAVTTPRPPALNSRQQNNANNSILIFSRVGISDDVVDLRIVGGDNAIVREFPHMAAIGFGDENDISWGCGGSLVSDEYILTAAHCLQSRGLIARWVLIGNLNLSLTDNQRQLFEVKSRIQHPDYVPGVFYNDIALLKLNQSVTFNDNIRPACLHSHDVEAGKTCIATGWGVVNESDEMSNNLLKVDLRIQNSSVCNTTFKYLTKSSKKLLSGFTSDSMICAGEPNGKDTCRGDSGGPIQIRMAHPPGMFSIIGVTSFGSGSCVHVTSAAAYMRVSYYLTWIVDTIWPAENT